jgi:hypothetical protein
MDWLTYKSKKKYNSAVFWIWNDFFRVRILTSGSGYDPKTRPCTKVYVIKGRAPADWLYGVV